MSPTHVRLDLEGRVAKLTLARPPGNVLDLATLRQIDAALAEVERSPAAAVILTGEAGLPFSDGLDVSDHVPERLPELLGRVHALFHRLDRMPQVSVSAVAGHALGGGMELALFCDLVAAEEDASFGQPEIELGCFPPVATAILPRLIGAKAAAELVLLGKRLPARRLHDLGAVNRLAPHGGVEATALALGREVAAHSRAVLAIARSALRAGRDLLFDAALETAEQLYREQLAATRDSREGVFAFLEKRKPRWEDR